MERVISYVDGFNLYFGLKDKGWRRYYWLNVSLLARNLLKPNQKLIFTKYFTSFISSSKYPSRKSKRQKTYLEALETLTDFKTYYGHYLEKTILCNNCRNFIQVPEEKMTDVNIATELISDAFLDNFDTAILFSGDSDLTGPILAVRRFFPKKRIIVGFPPQRHSKRLKNVANAYFTIGRKKIADSLFPEQVIKADGHILRKPNRWK